MHPLSKSWLAAAVLTILAASPVLAQESRREARPREQNAEQSAPAPAPPPAPRETRARERAPGADVRRAEPPAVEAPRQPIAERSRGTDRYGRVRAVPHDAAAPRPLEPVAPPPVSADAPRRSRGDAVASVDDDQRRAGPRGSRPRGDNPVTGRAVPRDDRGDRRGDDGRRGIYVPRSRVYNNYYYYSYPRRWYPYGYGAFGLGYFYYDPFTWYSYDPFWRHRYYGYYGGGYGGYRSGYGYYTGELRLQVHPKHAEVYVDGYFAGHVDDFDGIFQGLRLEEGEYHIEIVAPGYEPLEIDIRILPGRKTTYRGDLRPRP